MGWTAAALAACGGSGGERSADVTFPKGDVKFLKGTALEGPTKIVEIRRGGELCTERWTMAVYAPQGLTPGSEITFATEPDAWGVPEGDTTFRTLRCVFTGSIDKGGSVVLDGAASRWEPMVCTEEGEGSQKWLSSLRGAVRYGPSRSGGHAVEFDLTGTSSLGEVEISGRCVADLSKAVRRLPYFLDTSPPRPK
jgi:hypothetical protein